MNENGEAELRRRLMQAHVHIEGVKSRFYLAMLGWLCTGVYLWAHWYFDH